MVVGGARGSLTRLVCLIGTLDKPSRAGGMLANNNTVEAGWDGGGIRTLVVDPWEKKEGDDRYMRGDEQASSCIWGWSRRDGG